MISPVDVAVLDLNSEELGMETSSLMENAGMGLAKHLGRYRRILFFIGTGNNGGDGMVAARHLSDRKVHVVLVKGRRGIKTPLARKALEDIPEEVTVEDLEELSLSRADITSGFDVLVDGLLGSGASGEPRGPYKDIVELINGSGLPVVAIDIPTGTGTSLKVQADETVTFHDIKENMEECGKIKVVDIGIPERAARFVGKGDRLRIPGKGARAHKGQTGKVLIIGGGPFTGAPVLSSLGAIATGADLVRLAVPHGIFEVAASATPDLIVQRLVTDDPFKLGPEILKDLKDPVSWADSILVGPGSGSSHGTLEVLSRIIEYIAASGKPLVIDADAIKASEGLEDIDGSRVILTPHRGELRKLLDLYGIGFDEDHMKEPMKDDGQGWKIESLDPVVRFTKLTGADLLVKGPTDLIATSHPHSLNGHISHHPIHVRYNSTGVPEMSVGGTGDILAGLCAGFMAKGMSSFDSGCVSAYINGKAGELAKKKFGISLSASKLLDQIPSVLSSS